MCYKEKQKGRKARQTLIKGNVYLAHTKMLYFHLEGLTESSAVRMYKMYKISVGEMDTVLLLLIPPTPAA